MKGLNAEERSVIANSHPNDTAAIVLTHCSGTRLIKRDAVKNPVCNTPKASSVSAGRIERVKYEVEKTDPNVARCSAALRVADEETNEFAEVDHFRDTQVAAGTSKLYDEWSLRLWMEQILVSDGHYRGTPTRVRRLSIHLEMPRGLTMGEERVG